MSSASTPPASTLRSSPTASPLPPSPSITPPGNSSAQTWIVTPSTSDLLAFVTAVFGAVETLRVPTEDGGIGHAEFQIGDTWLLAFDSQPGWPPTPALVRVFVPDADVAVERAVTAGARVVTPLSDGAWGDRGGRVRDPWGNIWWVVQHLENVTPEVGLARMEDPQHAESMVQAQQTLDAELGGSGWSSKPAT